VSDVFISYSRDNQEAVRRLADAVKALGYDVWWDDQLPPHLAYGDVIAQKVGGAKAAIVVWSANAAASEWVRAEADIARNQRKLIQTTIDGVEPPLPFNQLHFVSLADWNGEADHPGWSRVKDSLVALAGPPAGEAPTVPPTDLPLGAAAAAVAAAAIPVPPVPEPEPAPASEPEPVTPPAPAPGPAPVTAAAPPPPPPPPAPAGPRKKGANKALLILIVLSVLVIAGVGVLAFLKKSPSAPAGNETTNVETPAENGATTAPGENFSQEAVLQGDAEFANVRAGPAADAPIVARVNAGEPFNTYTQDGIWWRVKIAGGLIGYLERANIRTRDPVGVPPLQPGNETAPANGVAPVETPPGTPPGQTTPPTVPGQTTPPPQQQRPPRDRPQQDRPPRRDPRINNQNAGVMYDYCYGAGAGTPQCRALGLGPRRRQPNK
jgi:hypothetical protein